MHLFEYRMKHATRRTLKIAKLFQLHRRIRWSKHVCRLSAGNAGQQRAVCVAPAKPGSGMLVTADLPESSGEAGIGRVKYQALPVQHRERRE